MKKSIPVFEIEHICFLSCFNRNYHMHDIQLPEQ